MLNFISKIYCSINRKLIMDCIVIAIPIILIVMYFNLKPGYVNDTLNNNNKIEKKIDSIYYYNSLLTNKIIQLEEKQMLFMDILNENNLIIEKNNKELAKLKQQYNDKINSINSYNISQLDSFFTSRYKDKY